MTRLIDWHRFWMLLKVATVAVVCMALVIGILVNRAEKALRRQIAEVKQGEVQR